MGQRQHATDMVPTMLGPKEWALVLKKFILTKRLNIKTYILYFSHLPIKFLVGTLHGNVRKVCLFLFLKT